MSRYDEKVRIRRIGPPDDEGQYAHWHEDVMRILRVLRAHGWDATYRQAEDAWDAYSDSVAAGWMNLPESDDCLYNVVVGFIEEDR